MVDGKGYQQGVPTLSREIAQKLFHSARAFFQNGDLKQAEKLYADLLEHDPYHFYGLYHQGMIARRFGKIWDAEKYFLGAFGIRKDFAPLFCSYGLLLHDLKKYEEAIYAYEKSIVLDPGYSPAYYNRGFTLEYLERLNEALQSYETAIVIQADCVDCHNNKGNTLKQLNRLDEAIFSYDRAIVLRPDYSAAYNNRGVALKDLDRLDQALLFYERATRINPNYTAAYNNRGVALQKLGRFKEALNEFKFAISLDSYFSLAHYNKGISLENLNEFDDACSSYSAAIVIDPNYAEAYQNHANALKKMWRLDEAISYYAKAIVINPEEGTAYNSLGVALQESKKVGEALNCYNKAIALMPDDAGAYSNRGMALKELNRFDEALFSFEKAVWVKPHYAEAFNNRGVALQDLKRFDAAIESFKIAINLDNNLFHAFSNLLFTMNYMPSLGVLDRLEEARQFGAIVTSRAKKKFTSWDFPKQSKKLKIGFVSGDFRNHPVGYFFEGFLSKIDQEKFEVFAYSTFLFEDDLTQRLKKHASVWRSIIYQSDADAAKVIYKDRLNILIDLAGHTAGNRLSVFAYKPAPVQVSWLGYFATTGVSEIDYFIGDPYVVPQGEEEHFIERIVRFEKSYLCFTPPQCEIEVGSLPALTNGYVTFGCFNNLAKLNSEVVNLWSRILQCVEGSKLLLKSRQLGDPSIIKTTAEMFFHAGVTSEQLIIEGPSQRIEYFESFNRVDIALDPFPFPGGTTTVEGLWMGVPVITLSGDRFIAHNGESIAYNSFQSAWVARDKHDYYHKAILFASDLEGLAKLRSGLRKQVLRSPLFDCEGFALNFEQLMMKMWNDYKKENIGNVLVPSDEDG